MKKLFNFVKNYWQFAITVVVGLAALITAFAMRDFNNNISRWAIIIWGVFVAITLFVDMVKTLRSGRYGVDILAITAIGACIAVGQFWAALIIVLMLTGGETLEDYAQSRAQRELSALLKRAPQIAHLIHNGKSGETRDVPVNEIKPGDLILVRSAEVVPVDGTLASDAAEFDESSLTGESLPVAKKSGDKVMSGSLNGTEAVTIRATATAKDSQYERIIALVREAEEQPAPFVRLSDRYAVPFTLISYAIAATAWIWSGNATRFAEVLVVASPCPLILAAPIALISGMSRASRHGIIAKNGAALEKFAAAKAIAFDKTGTLTHGVVEIEKVLPSEIFVKNFGKDAETKLVQLVAGAESGSSHVLASSLLTYAKKKKMKLPPASNVREITGSGIYATVEKHKILVGQTSFLKQNKIANTPDDDEQTSVFVGIDGEFAGRIVFADKLREETAATVAELKDLGMQEIVMLTGDNKVTAAAIAQKVGLDFRAQLLPEDKVREVKSLREKYGSAAMVGDGINDAPVLAASDVGIAMGARGSTAASESADVVIMLDDLSRVATLRQIAQRTIRVALQSVWWGIALCIVLMIIAAFGVIPALIGAVLQELIDVTVIFNALRAHTGGKNFAKTKATL